MRMKAEAREISRQLSARNICAALGKVNTFIVFRVPETQLEE